MKFNKVQFVYIDMDYLKKLNEVEPEIFYDENNENYKDKHSRHFADWNSVQENDSGPDNRL